MTIRSVTAAFLVILQTALFAQQPLPPGFVKSQPQQPQAAPAPGQAAQPGAVPLSLRERQRALRRHSAPSPAGTLTLQNASLTEVIDYLARQLKINYILDPRVRGGVTINTYGETKTIDNRTLLDTILRINGAAMIQVGDIYRIVPACRCTAPAGAAGDQRQAGFRKMIARC